MSNPVEIIATPFTVWLAAVGTAMPVTDAAPGGSWTKLGTSGPLNYGEEGVTIENPQTIVKWRSLGAAAPIAAFRTEEDTIIRLMLHDITLEQYRFALNGNAVATTAAGSGTAGFKTLSLERGLDVVTYALLARGGKSPYGAAFNMQYEIPIVFESGSPSVVFSKGAPAGLELSFEALRHSSGGIGRIVPQTALAL